MQVDEGENAHAPLLAAKAGQAECLRVALPYLHGRDEPAALKPVLQGGHLPCLQLLCEARDPLVAEDILVFAAEHAQSACVAYLAPLLDRGIAPVHY